MIPAVAAGLFSLGSSLIDKLIPDPEAKAKAKLELLELEQKGELTELQTRMSAILAEANSADPWTSRARPSFMYVFYVLILASIPMGVLHALDPEMATAIADGFRAWLAAIPSEMWTLFGVGYVGYAGARSWEKGRGLTK